MIEERKRNGDTAEEESKEGERESTWIQKRESVTSGGSGGSSQPEREREKHQKRNAAIKVGIFGARSRSAQAA